MDACLLPAGPFSAAALLSQGAQASGESVKQVCAVVYCGQVLKIQCWAENTGFDIIHRERKGERSSPCRSSVDLATFHYISLIDLPLPRGRAFAQK